MLVHRFPVSMGNKIYAISARPPRESIITQHLHAHVASTPLVPVALARSTLSNFTFVSMPWYVVVAAVLKFGQPL